MLFESSADENSKLHHLRIVLASTQFELGECPPQCAASLNIVHVALVTSNKPSTNFILADNVRRHHTLLQEQCRNAEKNHGLGNKVAAPYDYNKEIPAMLARAFESPRAKKRVADDDHSLPDGTFRPKKLPMRHPNNGHHWLKPAKEKKMCHWDQYVGVWRPY